MWEVSRTLFEKIRERVLNVDPDIIQLAEQKSVTYFCPAFFREISPRENRILLLLALEFRDLRHRPEIADDASQWKFVTNAVNEGGVCVSVQSEENIEAAVPNVTQTWSACRGWRKVGRHASDENPLATQELHRMC